MAVTAAVGMSVCLSGDTVGPKESLLGSSENEKIKTQSQIGKTKISRVVKKALFSRIAISYINF